MNEIASALGLDTFELCMALGACVFTLSTSAAILAATLLIKGKGNDQ